MYVHRDYDSISGALHGAVVAIGNFDGVHLGHQAVLREALGLASSHQVPCVVLTFHPHPRRYFKPQVAPLALEPLPIRLRRLRAAGVNGTVVLRFNQALARLSPQAFVERILVGALRVSHVVVGENFHFGRNRSGNIHQLQELAVTNRFGFTYVPPVMVGGTPVSSSRIRRCLNEAQLKEVATLLGRPYQLCGRVVRGAGRGSEILETPTANIRLEALHTPRYGVYAVYYRLSDPDYAVSGELPNEPGVANLGIRPSFDDHKRPLLEVHSLSETADMYGIFLQAEPVAFIRDEHQFPDSDSLRQQIQRDIASARTHLGVPAPEIYAEAMQDPPQDLGHAYGDVSWEVLPS